MFASAWRCSAAAATWFAGLFYRAGRTRPDAGRLRAGRRRAGHCYQRAILYIIPDIKPLREAAMNAPKSKPIADVQSSADTRHLAINRVGIKGIRHPVKVKDKSIGVQHTVATFNMYVHLPHNFKGTHMSRFVEILNEH